MYMLHFFNKFIILSYKGTFTNKNPFNVLLIKSNYFSSD